MKKIIVTTNNAPAAIGPYSQGIIFNNLIFTSGQIPVHPSTGHIPKDIAGQAWQAFENLKHLLEAGKSNLHNVIKVTIFIKNMNDFSIINEVYSQFFKIKYPARSCIEVSKLPRGVMIEIEAIAFIND